MSDTNSPINDIEARLASVVRNIKVLVMKIDQATQSDYLELSRLIVLAATLRAQADGAWGVLEGGIKDSGEE